MDDDLKHLRALFAFGVPGGRTKIQKRIGRYLDGADPRPLDDAPKIKSHIDAAVKGIKVVLATQENGHG